MSHGQDAVQPIQSSDRTRLIGLVLSNWTGLQEQLITILGHMANVPLPTARAIMFGVNCTAERVAVLRNVALAQSYTDWHLIQVARVLSRVEELDRNRRNTFEAPLLPATASQNTGSADVLSWINDKDLQELVARIETVSANLRELLDAMPVGQARGMEDSRPPSDKPREAAGRIFD